MLITFHYMFKTGISYTGLGGDFDRLESDRLKRHCLKRLEKLSSKVTLKPELVA